MKFNTMTMLKHCRTYLRLLLVSVLGLFAGCSECAEEPAPAPGPDAAEGVTVRFTANRGADTRTEIGDDGETVRWSTDDRIALWAYSGSSPAAKAAPVLDGTEFALATYDSVYSSADFTATIDPKVMPKGDYAYYAVSPPPASHTGSQVTFELPVVQNGRHDGGNDLLVAAAAGPELNESALKSPTLSFSHLCHAVRIEIPDGRNRFGRPVHRLEVEFPTEVVGRLTFDARGWGPSSSLPAVTLAEGSRTVAIDLSDNPIPVEGATGRYLWIFIAPRLINGTISFRAYDAEGFQSRAVASVSLNRDLLAGHATPMTVTVDGPRPVGHLSVFEQTNNLGEELTRLTLRSEQPLFVVPNSAEDGTEATAERSVAGSEGRFRFSVYTDVHSLASLQSRVFPAVFESENALFENRTVTLPAAITGDGEISAGVDVPYLFFEDFSTIGDNSYDDNNGTGGTSAGSNDAKKLEERFGWAQGVGWTGARIGSSAGKAIRLCQRGEKYWLTGGYNGRLDSAPMSALKPGANVSVKFSFNYSFGRQGSKNSSFWHYLAVGKHETQGPINAAGGGPGSTVTSYTIDANIVAQLSNNGDLSGSWDNINLEYTAQKVDGCTDQTRFVWEAYMGQTAPSGAYNNWVYLDNIRVSIVK